MIKLDLLFYKHTFARQGLQPDETVYIPKEFNGCSEKFYL